MLPYTKPHLSLSDQLALLKSRGLQVADDSEAMDCLHRNGYYRLSAYWYPFREILTVRNSNGLPHRQRTDKFLPGSKFEDARELYVFDKKFKLLLLDAIERVEIAVRAEIALHLGAIDAFAHTNATSFRPSFLSPDYNGDIPHQKWLARFNEAVRRSKDEFVLHHKSKYGSGSPIPIWIAIELWDFGQLSYFYSGMDTPNCIAVATRFGIPRWRLMESWVRTLNYVRNVIAHHGRLWNLNLSDRPSLPQQGVLPEFDVFLPLQNANARIYSICCILCHFSKVVNPKSSWPQQLIHLVDDFPSMPYANIQDMGFPTDWKNHNFWK